MSNPHFTFSFTPRRNDGRLENRNYFNFGTSSEARTDVPSANAEGAAAPATAITGPALLRPEEVPQDVICSICMSVPTTKPVMVSPCDHIFCSACLQQATEALQNQQQDRVDDGEAPEPPCCPMDRQVIEQVQPLREGSFAYRIWSQVQVKCEHADRGCSWTGCMSDVVKHVQESCRYTRESPAAMQQMRALQQETELQKRKMEQLEEELETTKVENMALRQLTEHLMKKNERHRPVLFDGTYNYDRYSVVALNQLISYYLEDKPEEIDRNKIFNCVRNCWQDYERGWTDNPVHYHLDMAMLLATCKATGGWFTDRQMKHIQSWEL